MKTLTISAEVLDRPSYVITNQNSVYSCAPYLKYFDLFRDAARERAWETFGTPDLQAYFSNGIEKFRVAFEEFSTLGTNSNLEDQKQLLFMLESLIHAKELMAEDRIQAESRV